MKFKIPFFVLIIALSFNSYAQSISGWSLVDGRRLENLANAKDRTFPSNTKYFQLDLTKIANLLYSAKDVRNQESYVVVSIPNIDGEIESYKVWEDSNFAPGLQAAYPRIRAYTGKGLTDPSAYLRISLAPNGIQTMVLRSDKKAEFIEPYTTDGLFYGVFNSSDKSSDEVAFKCTTDDVIATSLDTSNNRKRVSNTQSLKVFRLALSCTGEYTIYHGGTKELALAAMNATMTRVNGVYERELAVKMEIIDNNMEIIFTNPSTDPYSIADVGSNNSVWSRELNKTVVNIIGNPNFDIGHLFGASGGGGNAGCRGCVCVDKAADFVASSGSPESKASAYTSPSDSRPEGDAFDIDYVCHEMGHQFGAAHSFSHQSEGTGVNTEVASGSTIMGYAGITDYDIQKHSDAYFNYNSWKWIQDNLETKTCQTNIDLINIPPVVNAGADYTIPRSTAFKLTGTGTDADVDDVITYTWEQDDSGNQSVMAGNSWASITKTVGPTFRSFGPTTSPERYFPKLNTILNSTSTTPSATLYEALPSVSRTLNFVLTGRDNRPGGAQTNSDAMRVTVDGTKGPFYMTSQFASGTNWIPGSTQNITWSVASTNSIAGAANVDILLSTDNGQTYTTVLASNTPNDGSEVITVPDLAAPNCRIMVKPTGNIFFAINKAYFSIGYNVTSTCITPAVSTSIQIPSGSKTYSTSTLEVPNEGTVKSITVNVNLTHQNFSNLSLILVSPNGTEIELITRVCNGSIGVKDITFIDSGRVISCYGTDFTNVLPIDPLYTLIGEQAAGTWTLKYRDDVADHTGTINSWKLNLCVQNAAQLGNQEFSQSNEIFLYPNPTNEIVNISVMDENNLPDNFIVINSLGQTIYSSTIKSSADLSVNASKFANGVYFIKLNKDGQSKTLRFIKS
ncbi:MAG: reprolysin-like metallopeptidase [Flavobacterium sp.]